MILGAICRFARGRVWSLFWLPQNLRPFEWNFGLNHFKCSKWWLRLKNEWPCLEYQIYGYHPSTMMYDAKWWFSTMFTLFWNPKINKYRIIISQCFFHFLVFCFSHSKMPWKSSGQLLGGGCFLTSKKCSTNFWGLALESIWYFSSPYGRLELNCMGYAGMRLLKLKCACLCM